MPAHLVAAKVARRTSSQRTHYPAIALLLRVGVCGTIAGAGSLAVGVGVVGVVGSGVRRVGTLLRELIGGLDAGVLLVSRITMLL
jgi:hypothetical protein